MCGNEIVEEQLSPDGNSKAVIFTRDCGATTGFSTQISVLKANESPSGGGNAFVSDRGQLVEGWDGPWVEIKWLGRNLLEVRYDASAQLFEQDSDVDGVEVNYVPVSLKAR